MKDYSLTKKKQKNLFYILTKQKKNSLFIMLQVK